jgi:hypothetical protein
MLAGLGGWLESLPLTHRPQIALMLQQPDMMDVWASSLALQAATA